jgi:hypothetical protein
MANFKRNTRYTGARVTKNRSGQDFLILRRPLNLEKADGDVFITITQEDEKRPDLVAQKVYGNPDLWWVIYEFNGIRDPLFELKAGTQLRIPEAERVLQAIEQLRRG